MKSKFLRRAGFCVLVGLCASTLSFSKSIEPGSPNPLLRRFFWQQVVQASSVHDRRGRPRFVGNRAIVARRIDGQVNDFLKKTREQVLRLRKIFEQVKIIRFRILKNPPGSPQRQEAFSGWKQRLGDLADQANDIRKTLSYPFSGLDSKERFQYAIAPGAENRAFEKEVEFLEKQLVKAEQQIRDYLFVPTHTVTLDTLKGENMLINLYRVQKMSELLEKRL